MINDKIKLIASLISEDIDESPSEYEGLEDVDEFSEVHESWNGGERNGRWAFEGYPCPVNIGVPASIDARVNYDVTRDKGYRGDYYTPPEPAYLEVYNPETVWFRIWHTDTGDSLAYWRKSRSAFERVGSEFRFSVPAGLYPDNVIDLSDEQVKEIKDYFEDLWQEMDDRVMEYEYENPPDPPEPPEDW